MSAVLLVALLLPSDQTPEWGGFRGSNGCGVGAEAHLPDQLDKDANLRWRVDVPAGYSSPTVSGDRVFLTAAEGKELVTMCFSREDGSQLWRSAVPFPGRRTGANSPAAPSPVTDGEQVYCLFQDYGLLVYDLDGEEVWHESMEPFTIPHGMSGSPVLHEDSVLLQLDQDSGSSLVSYDKFGAGENWRTERPGFTHSYSTPAVYAPQDGPAQVIVSGSFKVCSYSFETGDLLWWVEGGAFMTKPVPQVVGDRCVVCTYAGSVAEAGLPRITQSFAEACTERDADHDGKISKAEYDHPGLQAAWLVFDLDDDGALDERDWEYLRASGSPTGGLYCLRMDGSGDVTGTHVEWKYDGRRGLPDVTSPVVYGGQVYVVKEGGLLTAFDLATGELGKQDRVGDPDRYFASPVAADGKLLLASHSGQLCVVRAGAEWETLSVHSLEEETWSTPALVGDDVLVRTQKALYCFDAAGS